ncbi:MAG: hypothetical protein PHV34_24945 [Verrucomicrobiae bacterium]|nr:hypothetical protein [Verrucomicrobiae bacterium]
MPYIKPENRKPYDPLINELVAELKKHGSQAGDLNYVFSRVAKALLQANLRYDEANKLIGAIECVKLELYRRAIAPYEDGKIVENGDI